MFESILRLATFLGVCWVVVPGGKKLLRYTTKGIVHVGLSVREEIDELIEEAKAEESQIQLLPLKSTSHDGKRRQAHKN